jgi:putative ABC transport system ATP-binding protein
MAVSSAPDLVVARGLCREFRRGSETVRALWEVDMDIREGDYVGLAGRSGSGKSTLLHLLGCLDRPTRGHLMLAGVDGVSLREADRLRLRRETVGFVFQAFHLVPHLTALENVALPLRYRGVPGRERMERAAAALAQVGLSNRIQHAPHQLSGGEAQRVSLARAVVSRPRLLLADEPTGELDTVTAAGLADLLEGLHREGMTIVVATHDEALLARTRRRFHLQDGRLDAP